MTQRVPELERESALRQAHTVLSRAAAIMRRHQPAQYGQVVSLDAARRRLRQVPVLIPVALRFIRVHALAFSTAAAATGVTAAVVVNLHPAAWMSGNTPGNAPALPAPAWGGAPGGGHHHAPAPGHVVVITRSTGTPSAPAPSSTPAPSPSSAPAPSPSGSPLVSASVGASSSPSALPSANICLGVLVLGVCADL